MAAGKELNQTFLRIIEKTETNEKQDLERRIIGLGCKK